MKEKKPLEIKKEEMTEEIKEELTKTFEPASQATPETFEPATKQTNTQSQATSFSRKNTSFHKPYSNKITK